MAGLRSVTFYDHADRPAESYGPAPASYYGVDDRPNNTGPVPYSTSRYDEGMQGLAGAYWNVGAIVGSPKMHGQESGATAGVYDLNWGNGGPSGLGVVDNWDYVSLVSSPCPRRVITVCRWYRTQLFAYG